MHASVGDTDTCGRVLMPRHAPGPVGLDISTILLWFRWRHAYFEHSLTDKNLKRRVTLARSGKKDNNI